MAAPIRALQILQPQSQPEPQSTGLSAAVLALAASLDRLAAAVGGPAGTATGQGQPAPESPQASWQALPVRRLRALLRRYPIDRSSLPAPIETMRRAELLEALRQVQGLEEVEG